MSEKVITENSAGGIVFKKKAAVFYWLVIQHSKAKHWGFPKGHIGDTVPDEKREEAALREVQEEGGISAQIISHTPFTIHYSYRVNDATHNKTVNYFLMEFVSGKTEDHDWEVQEAIFMPEEQLLKTLTYDTDKEAFAKAKKMLSDLRSN